MPERPDVATLDRLALRQEFFRALTLIDDTQLELFRQGSLLSRAAIEHRVESIVSEHTNPVEATRALLRDVLQRYDDVFAAYIDPIGHTAYANRRAGDLVGIGLKYRVRRDNYPLVIGALLGGPLEATRLRSGDQLERINGRDLAGLPKSEVVEALGGVSGSEARLALRGPDDQAYELVIRRRPIELHYVRSELLEPGLGYIRISRFGTDSHERVLDLVESLGGTALDGLVIDLRDNPGGSTRAARIVASMFDELDWIFCEHYKSGTTRQLPREGDKRFDMALCVLVNETSQSSAEILAGALQSTGRATIVGTPTYGKGLIQKVYPLEPPLDGALRTTIATWSTPSRHAMHGRGLIPDVYVPSAPIPLFKETGSLNIRSEARALQRQLLLEDLAVSHSPQALKSYRDLPDTQLETAIAQLH